MKIVLASSNEHKVKEINAIVSSLPILGERVGMRDQCITESVIEFILPPSGFDPIEDGKTFEENSYIKAHAAWKITKNWVLADDSGLCIDALNGAPGIHSARYAETPQERINRVLNEMKNIDNRSARFKCCMTLINPDGNIAFSYTGICEGSIITEQRGLNGFGYDPIFLLNDSEKTMAELTEAEKNQVSHRGKALCAIINHIKNEVLGYEN